MVKYRARNLFCPLVNSRSKYAQIRPLLSTQTVLAHVVVTPPTLNHMFYSLGFSFVTFMDQKMIIYL